LIKIGPGAKYDAAVNLEASSGAGNAKFSAEINDAGKILDVKLGIINLNSNK
jgi:hypothetical protein